MARIDNKMPLYGDSSSSDMEALQSLYMQVQQPQQAFTQWPQARSNTPYAPQVQPQQQQAFEQWPNMQQQPRSKTPPFPAQVQPQQTYNMQQQRSKTPPPCPSQVQPQQALNFQQQRSKTPPAYPSQVQPQQAFDQWPNMQQQQRSNTPAYPPYPQMQQPQQAFNQWPNSSYPQMQPQMQQPQQPFNQWPNKQPPPARPAPPTNLKVPPAIVPEPSAIASSSSSRPQQLVHSTLTEPVSATLARDIKRVAHNLRQIVVPSPNRVDPASALREWDLWGPFFFIICLSCILSSTASTNKGGKLNFLQSLSVLGYCLFPLDVGAILCLAKNNKIYRSAIVLITLLWSSWSVYPFVSTAVRQSRKALAVYPVFLMYISMGFLVLANG